MEEKEIDLLNEIKRLPKYIRFKQDIYVPIIIKNEHECNDDAYIAMYAKETTHFYSRDAFLIRVEGRTFLQVLEKFIRATDDYLYNKHLYKDYLLTPADYYCLI